MGSVIKIGDKWRAQVRRKGFKAQCRTFATKARADAWARQLESDMDAGTLAPQLGDLTVAQVIKAYRKMRGEARPVADTSNEHYMLNALERGLGATKVALLGPSDLVAFATMRRDEGAGPYTINMDVSKLGTVMRYGGAALKVAMPDVVGSSRPLLSHLRLIGGGGMRERRPTEDELLRIIQFIGEKRGTVYAEAVAFSAVTAMRRGEVCAILKAEIDQTSKVIPVWRKHPRKGKVLERVPLLGDAWHIAARQPDSEDGRLFPIEPGTLSKYLLPRHPCRGSAACHLYCLVRGGCSNNTACAGSRPWRTRFSRRQPRTWARCFVTSRSVRTRFACWFAPVTRKLWGTAVRGSLPIRSARTAYAAPLPARPL